MLVQPRSARLIICFSFLAILLAGCNSSETEHTEVNPAETPAYGDCFIDAYTAEPLTLMPPNAGDAPSWKVIRLIYNGLVKYNDKLEIVPDLAKEIKQEFTQKGDKKSLTITFKLRKGVLWHDREPFTAKDVQFTLEVMQNPKTETPYKSSYRQAKAKVVDPYTFQVTYTPPFAPALDSWTMPILPKHYLEGKDLTKMGQDKTKYPGGKPIGTGPYQFEDWVREGDKRIILTRNPCYFLGRPHLDRYEYRVCPDQATMLLQLKAGDIDRMELTPFQYMRQTEYPQFASMFNKNCYRPFLFVYLGYNQKKALFKSTEVRQALSLAIDKEEIVKGVLLGLGEEATGPYKPGDPFYNPNVSKIPYDPDRAKELLKAEGWQQNRRGVLEKNGRPFKFTIITNRGNDIRVRTAETIQRQLRKVGIMVEIRTLEWGEFDKAIENRSFEAVLGAWETGPDPDQYDIWHSTKTKPKEFNFIHYNNSQVDKDLEKGRSAFDEKKQCVDKIKQREAYFDLQKKLEEDQPCTFLFIPYALPVIHKRFQAVKFTPWGDYNFHEWYVPERQRLRSSNRCNSVRPGPRISPPRTPSKVL